MALTWADRQEERGAHLELSQHKARNCWKKFRDGKHYYLHHPITKAGYQAALLEWSQIAARLDGARPNAQQFHHHRDLFRLVLNWFDHFGIPTNETKLAKQVEEFLKFLDDQLGEPDLPAIMPFMSFTSSTTRPEFSREFIHNGTGFTLFGSIQYSLPPKWQERIRQLDESPKSTKRPQTIEYWLDRYITRAKARSRNATKISTAIDRANKVRKFKNFSDTSKHVSTIKAETLDDYHAHLDSLALERSSKVGYFNAFRMFVRWASKQEDCDLAAPANLDDREFGFRERKGTGRKRLEKRRHLWTPEDFTLVLKNVPQPYRCFCVLMLNCGFRSTDLSNLRHGDLDLEAGRITIQREKMNQNESSPVVSYPLWPMTIDLVRDAKSDDPTFVFRGPRGGPLVVQRHKGDEITAYDNLSMYWSRNREKFGLTTRRLDFIRKTGSTTIERSHRGVETLYLGESLSSMAALHYNFNDGEPCPELDEAIAQLGLTFGLVKGTKKQHLTLPVDLVTSLTGKARAKGVTVEQLLGNL